MPDLRVLVVADDPLARAGLAAMISAQPGLAVSEALPANAELVEAAGLAEAWPEPSRRADVVLWDLGEGAEAALVALVEARDALPPVLALLSPDARAIPAWSARARGILRRDATPAQLAAAAMAVAEGFAVVDPAFADQLLPRLGPVDGATEPLTPRETEVLNLLAEGLGNKAIADRLGVTDNTVKFHVNAILGKLGAQSRTEAVTTATRLGIVLL